MKKVFLKVVLNSFLHVTLVIRCRHTDVIITIKITKINKELNLEAKKSLIKNNLGIQEESRTKMQNNSILVSN